MSLHFSATPLLCSSITNFAWRGLWNQIPKSNCVAYASLQSTVPVAELSVARRTANYQPSLWDYGKLTSLTSKYTDDKYRVNVEEMKENTRKLINDSIGSKFVLDLIDAIQRLGLGHYYQEEIKRALQNVHIRREQWLDYDLYTASLAFRLLRQHRYEVTQDVFDKFKDQNGRFKACLCEDGKGLLSLYEASYLGLEGENLLDEAKVFTTQHLKDFSGDRNTILAKKVSHSLDLPLHWRMSRLESRWYIDIYENEDHMIPTLLDFAKLDYNIVQATHQSEVKRLARWWADLDLYKMKFFRDRIVEHYFWSLGMVAEEQYGRFRVDLAKITTLITVIDDIYDVYGSLEELVLFTNAIERWEVRAMGQLPHYMQVCYMALLKTCNDIAYEILKEQGFDITTFQRKIWLDICYAYLTEAKWFYTGHIPTLEEYLKNAVVSIGAAHLLKSCYFLTTKKITKEALSCIDSMPSLIHNSSLLVRLADDLATSKDEMARGDNPKSIQCYMHEAGVSEEVARKHIKYLINETWKKVNKALLGRYPFSEPFITAAPNLSRQAQCMYQYGDGHGVPDKETKDQLNLLLIQPIPFNN